MINRSANLRASLGGAAALVMIQAASAQLPVARLSTIFPPGGQQGTQIETAVTGIDLDDLSQLYFSHEKITAAPKAGGSAAPGGPFLVTIGSNVPPGIYEARAKGRFGISNPRAFVVGDRPEIREAGGNHSLASAMEIPLNTEVNARADANAMDHFKFAARAGQRLLIHLQDQEIDSRAEAVLILHDSAGAELLRNRRGELLDFNPKEDGIYVLKIHDFVYRGGEDYFYRFRVSTGPHIDFALPGAGLAGAQTKQVLFGRNLPGGSPSAFLKDGKTLDSLEVAVGFPDSPHHSPEMPLTSLLRPPDAALDGFDYRLPSADGVSNPVRLSFSTAPVVAEAEPNDSPSQAQPVSLPCEIAGQFYPRLDRDWFAFDAGKGEVYWIEVFSHRLGSPSNPFVLVQRVTVNDQGQEKVSDLQELYDSAANIGGPEFNTSSRDPVWRFEVKEPGRYRVQVRDLFNRAKNDPSLLYRLSLRRETPDFRLVALVKPPPPQDRNKKEALLWAPFVRRGETAALEVLALRQDNFKGEISLRIDGLPPGVRCNPATVEEGKNSATLFITAEENAAAWTGPIRVIGRSRIADAEIVREARGGSLVWTVNDYNNEAIPSRVTRDFRLAVSGHEAAPLSVMPSAEKAWEAPEGGKVEIPIQVVRRGEFNDAIKLKATGIAALDSLKELEVGGQTNAASLEIDLSKNKLPAGSHTFYLAAQTKGKYRRITPAEIEQAEKAAQQAEALQKEAEQKATELAAAAKQAQETLTAAAKTLEAAQAKFTAAVEKLSQSKDSAEQNPTQDALTAAVAEAQRLSAQAESEAKAAAQTKEAAEQKARELAAQAKEAEEKKDAAIREAKEAKDALKKGEAKDLTITAYSVPITLKVHAKEGQK